jgi:hypothetical protein
MYQSLIWALSLRDDARRLGPPLDAEDCQRLANALIDGVRRNVKLGGDFLRVEVLIDEEQAVELSGRQSCNARRHQVRLALVRSFTRRFMRVV